MSWFFQSTSSKLEKLRYAENRLLEYAKRHVVPNANRSTEDDDSSYTTTTTIDVIDTKIPRAAIPLKKHTIDKSYPTSDDKNHYIIHSVRVISNEDNDTDPSNNKSDTPLVILHGYMNGGAYFYRNFVGLSSYYRSIYALDMLGWGLSSRPDLSVSNLILAKTKSKAEKEQAIVKATEDFFVESLEAWRQANNIEKFTLAGHSMGGYLSVAYVERYPQYVDKLILISPVGVPEYSEETRQQDLERQKQRPMTVKILFGLWNFLFHYGVTAGDVFRTIPEQTVKNAAMNYVQRRLPLLQTQDEQIAVADYLLYNNTLPGSGEYCVDKLLTETVHARIPLVDRIPNLNVSHVGFLYGEYDWMDVRGAIQVELDSKKKKHQNQQQKSSTPDVDVYCVHQSGHLLMLENWAEFNNAMLLLANKPNPYTMPAGTTHPTKLVAIDYLKSMTSSTTTGASQQSSSTTTKESTEQQQEQQPLVSVGSN